MVVPTFKQAVGILGLAIFLACFQGSFAQNQLSIEPVTPAGKFVKPLEVLNSQEAMTPAEIRTMLRTRLPESEILHSITQRGLVYAITGRDAAELGELGASPRILEALKTYDYVLTSEEFTRYQARQSKQARDKEAHGIQLWKQEEARALAEQERNFRISQANQQMIENGADANRRKNELLSRQSSIKYDLELLKKRLSRTQQYVPGYSWGAQSQTNAINDLKNRIQALEDEASKVDWELRKLQ